MGIILIAKIIIVDSLVVFRVLVYTPPSVRICGGY